MELILAEIVISDWVSIWIHFRNTLTPLVGVPS